MQLVDPIVKGIIGMLDRAQKLSGELRKIPFEFLERARKDPATTNTGPRSLYWMLASMTSSDGENDAKVKDSVTFAVGQLEYSRHKDRDRYWVASALQAIWVLDQYLADFGSGFAAERATLELTSKSYETALLADLPTEEDLRNSDFVFYECFWLLEALRVRLSEDTVVSSLHLRFCRVAHLKLQEQMTYFSSDAPAANHIVLAIATVGVGRLIKDLDVGRDTREMELAVKQSLLICFKRARKFAERRLVLKAKRFGPLFNLPWEDLLILGEVDAAWLPDELPLVDHVIDYLMDRRLAEQGRVIGMLEEGSPDFPKASIYFSGFANVLLARLIMLLKGKLRALIIARIRNVDPSYIDEGKTNLELGAKDFSDTQEDTGRFFADKIKIQASRGRYCFQGGKNTILLFGPPGTGKTTLIQALVKLIRDQRCGVALRPNLDWVSITLNPSLFLTSDSYSKILEHVADVFEVILHLEHCVVFFDEAEELVRTRGEGDDRLGRLFTAAMLPQLVRFDKATSLVIFATNYIDKMDDAAIRKGRFWLRKGMGWMNAQAISRTVSEEFQAVTKDDEARAELVQRLQRKTFSEVKAIYDAFKRRGACLDRAEIEDFFTNTWKPYSTAHDLARHVRNCSRFDDSYTRKRAIAELKLIYEQMEKDYHPRPVEPAEVDHVFGEFAPDIRK